jgi:hypothetical protein
MTLEARHHKILSKLTMAWYTYQKEGLEDVEIQDRLLTSLEESGLDGLSALTVLEEVEKRVQLGIDKHLN